ncbi:MAG: RNB domain-containing ribonuclease, partial [Proteobacteria bacterium]|nr:RNB domain-containing ribonuclease [Pseudomonadota bacterium]
MKKRKRNSSIPRRRGKNRTSRPTKFQPSRFRSPKTWVGRIQKNPRGFAFVIPPENGQEDTYVSPREARSLMNGDIVEYRVHHQGSRSEAEIVKVIERACTKLLGQVHGSRQKYFLETAEGDFVSLENANEGDLNTWVIAQIRKYPDDRSSGTASIKEVLGSELLPKHDHLITISRFNIQEQFSQEVLKEAERLRESAEAEYRQPFKGRKDLRHLPFVTIDGEDAKDFDDAILVEQSTGQQAFTLYVAIADVSFFVRPSTSLDQEALRRSTSTYFPGYCIPMLPESLSNDLCSLNPKTDKLVLVAEIRFDRNGIMLESFFYEGIIRTAARLTYTQVHEWFKGNSHALPPECRAPLANASELFQQLQNQRLSRGVLDFQLPECRFELDKDGMPSQAYPFPSWESHRLIEEFMVSANSAVAKVLKDFSVPTLYRIHETPEIEAIEELNQLMKSLGFSLMLKEVSPQAFSKI